MNQDSLTHVTLLDDRGQAVYRIQPNKESDDEKEVKSPQVYGINAYLLGRFGPLE